MEHENKQMTYWNYAVILCNFASMFLEALTILSIEDDQQGCKTVAPMFHQKTVQSKTMTLRYLVGGLKKIDHKTV